MKKKQQKIQIALISIGLLLIISTYFYYPLMKKAELAKDQLQQKKLEKNITHDKTTFFENVEYKGLYDLNKPFIIKSEEAYILNEEPDIVYMNTMHVILYLNDGRIVNIISNKGRYNKRTYDCFFEDEVRATDGNTNIFADNLDLLAIKNSVNIYNNVRLNDPTSSLQADKIDYNFETKLFKVSMFDDNAVSMKVIK
jgi:hypothetical protein